MSAIKLFIKPHFFGLLLMVGGWYISIMNIAIDKFTSKALINNWTLSGLGMIILGAYLPEIFRMFQKKS